MNNTDALITTDKPISDDQRKIFETLVVMMVPASEEYAIPGADDPQIFANILATPEEILTNVTKQLEPLNDVALEKHANNFIELPEEDRLSLLTEFNLAHPIFAQTLISITLKNYYQDDRIMESLGMEARPPYPEGFTVQQGDWSLLDPVKQREKMYREDS